MLRRNTNNLFATEMIIIIIFLTFAMTCLSFVFFFLLKFRFMSFPKQHVSVVKFESQNNLKKASLKKTTQWTWIETSLWLEKKGNLA